MLVHTDESLVQRRIEELLEAPTTGEDAPSLDRLETTLTDGYAEALALEAERSRIERRIGEVAPIAHEPVVAEEIAALARRRTVAEDELGTLRALLGRLQARARASRRSRS